MKKIIGIDLGTTNSCYATMEGNEPKVIPNREGGRTTPSVISLDSKGERKVGTPAKRQAITKPQQTVFSIKRFMGKEYHTVRDWASKVPYKVEPGDKDRCMVNIQGRRYTPQELSAMVLQEVKSGASDYLGSEVTEAVITVPAHFNDHERQATKEAGKIAGLKVLRNINEPTAAALAYGLGNEKKKEAKIAVYDLGGGTFDISILQRAEGVFEVLSTDGDTGLGGDDFDQRIIEWLTDTFKKEEGIDLSKDVLAMQRLKEAAEKAKQELSSATTTEINLPFISASNEGPKHLNVTLTRSAFERMTNDLIERTLGPCERAVKDAKIDVKEIDEVLLVGGSTRIPKVQEAVENFFKKAPTKGVNPDEVVACGAAIQAGIIAGHVDSVLLLDVTPLSLGIETLGGVFTRLIDKNTTIPTTKKQVFSTAEDNQPGVDIKVYQGEREMTKHNKLLGRFHLDGIPPAPRGKPQIEVTFDIDANGIVSVSAKDKESGKAQNIRIESSSTLSKEEIEKMTKEAEQYAEADQAERKEVEMINKADAIIFELEKTLQEEKDKLPQSAEKVQAYLDKLKEAHGAKDTKKIEELLKEQMSIYSLIAKEKAAAAQAKSTAAEAKGEDEKSAPNVKEASFEDMPEK